MTEEQKVPEVLKAIIAVKAELAKEGIGKDQTNTHQKYKFRGIDDIYNALSSLMAANNLSIMPKKVERWATEREKKGGESVTIHVTVKVVYEFISSIDESAYQVEMWGEAMDFSDKATNKAMSAAYKYACLQVFCIPTQGDGDEGDKDDIEAGRERKPPVFATSAERNRFCTNTIKAINDSQTVTALNDLIQVNMEMLNKMRNGAEYDAMGAEEVQKAYRTKLEELKAPKNVDQAMNDPGMPL
jgi:ERF superfamily